MKRSLTFLILILSLSLTAQKPNFFTPSDTFVKPKFIGAMAFTVGTYGAITLGLSEAWYADYDQTGFHTFDDWGEWEHMDKFAHMYDTYFQSRLVYNRAKWAGMKESSSMWTGIATGMLFQTTVEVLDAYSTEWGFSWADMGANVVGAAAFGLQQHFWKEQRISFKISSSLQSYPSTLIISDQGNSIPMSARARDLYGEGIPTLFLKDYNSMTIWSSFNIASFTDHPEWLPPWLNLAVGIGAENMFGGFDNTWENEYGRFEVDLPRYRQYFLSFDIDLTKIKTDNDFLRSMLRLFNIVKIPAPGLEFSNGQVKGRWLMF